MPMANYKIRNQTSTSKSIDFTDGSFCYENLLYLGSEKNVQYEYTSARNWIGVTFGGLNYLILLF